MARRYDSRTTIFSPEGRLYQVEYAMEAISHAGAAVGILAKDGVVLAAEKKVTNKLLDTLKSSEKMYVIDSHISCAVAGILADANTLINYARLVAQRYRYMFQEPIPVEQLVQELCDLKQSYTQYGGLRPFGVSFLFAGYDRHHGFQLYQSDPSGNYGGWKATAIGQNRAGAQSILKQEYKDGGKNAAGEETATCSLDDALLLATKVLANTMDSTQMSADKLEFSILKTVEGDDVSPGERHPIYRVLTTAEMKKVIADHEAATAGTASDV